MRELADRGVRRVVLPLQPMPWWDNSDIAATALAEEYSLIDERRVGAWQVQTYTRPPLQLAPVGVAFQDGLTLDRATVEPVDLPAGGVLAVHMQWVGSQEGLTGTEKVTLQVLNDQNQMVAQRDEPFTAAAVGAAPGTYGILLPEGVPAGTYRVIAALYRPEQGGPSRLLTTDGNDFVSLATIHIR